MLCHLPVAGARDCIALSSSGMSLHDARLVRPEYLRDRANAFSFVKELGPRSLQLGGSAGAIFGLGAATALLLHRHRERHQQFSSLMLKSLGQSLLINVVFGMTSSRIDNWQAQTFVFRIISIFAEACYEKPACTVQLDVLGVC